MSLETMVVSVLGVPLQAYVDYQAPFFMATYIDSLQRLKLCFTPYVSK